MNYKIKLKRIFTRPFHPVFLILFLILSVVLNLALSYFNNIVIHSPLFLDSIFTAVSAVFFGPLAGMAVGLLTNIFMEFQYGMTGLYWPFALCNMATGLILGVMSRKGLFENAYHVVSAILAVSLANALLGALVAYLLFQGDSGVQIDKIVYAFINLGQSLFTAGFWARIPANLIDKMFTVYLAFLMKKAVFSE
ncbi:ECF transporter S component [Oceanispirochaeta sp.]|jgi:energy-coupling factor transport system substrate-specific component|uniref:ECF transporter S component n=1 Tax=Oceanispirochaeta sp. TaxID=2035350 RepID=UPI00260B77B5|nr:ECF transporter S component [Oceanispirochaeta sp.]MDA3956855.1 ECF transporter S component [Oceanispirochaeta sp.]